MAKTSFEKIMTASSDIANVSAADRRLAILEETQKFNDGERAEAYRKNIHSIVVCGIWVIGILLVLLLLIRVFHLAVPERWHWLSRDAVHSMDAVLFSSLIFSLASKYFGYYDLFVKRNSQSNRNPFGG